MNDKLKIHRAGTDEIDTIVDLAYNVWPVTYKDILSPEQVDYMIELFYSRVSLAEQFKKHSFLIASFDNKPIGFASYSPSLTDGIYKLHKLYINTEIQGQGLGRALISFVIEELKVLNATALVLNVNRNNKARMFYEKLGFRVIREEEIDIGHNYWMIDYVMRLDLTVSNTNDL